MLILACDTTHEEGGVGIFRDAECLASVPHDNPAEAYSIALFKLVEQALTQANVELSAIELFAAANGPGSFTGIRVGLAAALAWGKVFDRPVRGVSVLDAMANAAPLTTDWAFPIVDARRNEFYVSSFRRRPSAITDAEACDYEQADDGWIFKPDALREFLNERLGSGASAACVVRAGDQAAVELHSSLPPAIGWQTVEGILVKSIAAIARREQQCDRPSPRAKLDAYYIRRPDAEIKAGG